MTKATNMRFVEDLKSFAFDGEIFGRTHQCLVSLKTVEYLSGKQADEDCLMEIAKLVASSGEPDALLLTLHVVEMLYQAH